MTKTPSRQRLFSFESGGWVLLLAGLLSIVVVVVTVAPVIRSIRNRPPGDGADPVSYAFSLEPATVPLEAIVPAQHHRDLTSPLVDPPSMTIDDVAEWNRTHRGNYLVANDLVVGIVVDGAARAYPMLVLTTHEVVNDSLGGRAICVTYNPLCGSAVAFDRGDRTFGVSGLVLQSNHLLYDRRGDGEYGGESLWAQVPARAVTGPATGTELDLLPVQVMHWVDWMERHPDTTVLRPDDAMMDRYKKTSYKPYYASQELVFDVDPPIAEDETPMAPLLVIDDGDEQAVVPFADIRAAAVEGPVEYEIAGRSLRIEYRQDPEAAWVEVDEGTLPAVRQVFSFAWTRLGE